MLNWSYIRENYPNALKEYLRSDWSLEDFWNAYGLYVKCRLIERETGAELWEWKISSKIVIYSTLCYKSIIKDGKKIDVYSYDEVMEKRMNEIFKLIEDQIKDDNFLSN
jgi:hypothetical protein